MANHRPGTPGAVIDVFFSGFRAKARGTPNVAACFNVETDARERPTREVGRSSVERYRYTLRAVGAPPSVSSV